MDLIRAFTEVAFSRVAERWLSRNLTPADFSRESFFPLDTDTFLDEARIYHPELSDNSLSLIYRLGRDEWCRFGFEDTCSDDANIFQSLAFITDQILEERDSKPIVHFKDIFRWREVTQLLGEDLMTCAFLAFRDKTRLAARCGHFDWPSVIHNDNPDLNYLFKRYGLCELHSHLNASSNTFEITWVSLMNHIGGLHRHFEYLAERHEPSARQQLGNTIYDFTVRAVRIRWAIHQFLISDDADFDINCLDATPDAFSVDARTSAERESISRDWIPDYIVASQDSPMAVYAGERMFLYRTLLKIFKDNDPGLTFALYSYVLSKSLLRSYFIQLNNNAGFSNFKRYQDVKNALIHKEYGSLIEALPLWEAKHHNFTKIFETRVPPLKNRKNFERQIIRINKLDITNEDSRGLNLREALDKKDWLVIFHFLKRHERNAGAHKRNHKARKDTKTAGIRLSTLRSLKSEIGIDAASSEFAARPEVYAQAFRFLRNFGFKATFHAGEDFYDIADGLRAIDEAINFLGLDSADRIGHALALGIDAGEYYRERHNVTAVPKQWMLDNVVWLYMKSREFGIAADTKTDWFLVDTYKRLTNEIGIRNKDSNIPDIADYWDSMALRGDSPDRYSQSGEIEKTVFSDADSWDFHSMLYTDRLKRIREFNPDARRLYVEYHFNPEVRSRGELVRAFELPPLYHQFITGMQDAMIKDICKRQICIECCPSSNVRIGRLKRFDSHPIARFMPIDTSVTRYPLAVTVNTDDLGVFSTSLPNEYSLLALAMLKKTRADGSHLYSKQEVYDWIERLIKNGHKYSFIPMDELFRTQRTQDN